MEYVVDFDDFYLDPANGLNWLYYLKGKYSNFKATLFTIPGRTPMDWLKRVYQNTSEWLQFAVHGMHHDDEEETYKWTDKTAYEFLRYIESTGLFVKGFKGPNWKVSNSFIRILNKKGYWLAVRKDNELALRKWPLTDMRSIHGHIWMMDTHNKEGKLTFEPNSEFKFINEVI